MFIRYFGPKKNTTVVYGSPSVRSAASLLMLKDYYQKHDADSWRRNVVFSILFLRKWKEKHGYLQCCFCGKSNLQIDTPYRPVPIGIMATVDHFIPQAEGIDPKEEANLVVACSRCNNNKKDKRYELNTLKFIPIKQLDILTSWLNKNNYE